MKSDVKQGDEVGLDEGLMDGKDALVFGAPANESERLRAAVESVHVNRTKDGKPYGVKRENTKGRITAKQRLFASLIVKGDSPREAYKKAYNCLTANESTVAVSANRLMNDPKVDELIQASLGKKDAMIINDAVAARRYVMEQLIDHSKEMKSESSKLKALELIGKAVGMFTDKVETKVEEISVDGLKRELEVHLELLDKAAIH